MPKGTFQIAISKRKTDWLMTKAGKKDYEITFSNFTQTCLSVYTSLSLQ